jgi:hypothetical protein
LERHFSVVEKVTRGQLADKKKGQSRRMKLAGQLFLAALVKRL